MGGLEVQSFPSFFCQSINLSSLSCDVAPISRCRSRRDCNCASRPTTRNVDLVSEHPDEVSYIYGTSPNAVDPRRSRGEQHPRAQRAASRCCCWHCCIHFTLALENTALPTSHKRPSHDGCGETTCSAATGRAIHGSGDHRRCRLVSGSAESGGPSQTHASSARRLQVARAGV